jgi:hypothetical protein
VLAIVSPIAGWLLFGFFNLDVDLPPTVAPPADSGPPTAPAESVEPKDVQAENVNPSPAVVSAPIEQTPLTMDEIPVSTTSARIVIDMFGDAAFRIDSQSPDRPAFVLGPLDLLIFGQYAGLVAMTEMALETQPGGAVGIDLERLFVRWRGDRLTIDLGRTHSELGYWNNAFHHGRWLQTTVDRPRAVRFEDDGGTLPIHSVGVTARWQLLTGARQLELVGAIANGRGDTVDDIHVADDTNAFKSLLLKLEARGFGARDLRFGIAGVYDRIAPASALKRPALPGVSIQEAIGNIYAAYRGQGLICIAEAFDILHAAAGQRWNTFDAFMLAGYRLGRWVPYALGEVRTGDIARDPYFSPTDPLGVIGPLPSFAEATIGVRREIKLWSAIKVEYRLTDIEGVSKPLQRWIVDWTFGF